MAFLFIYLIFCTIIANDHIILPVLAILDFDSVWFGLVADDYFTHQYTLVDKQLTLNETIKIK